MGHACSRTSEPELTLFRHARVRRTRKGTYELDVPEDERDVLRRSSPSCARS